MSKYKTHIFTALLLAACPCIQAADNIAEVWSLYDDGLAEDRSINVWGMSHAELLGGTTNDGRYLGLNQDWSMRPWAGFKITGGDPLPLTKDWMEKGFLFFQFNQTVTRYDEPNGQLNLQVIFSDIGNSKNERILSGFIDGGRGRDEDPASWQEVWVPLSHFRSLSAGKELSTIVLQVMRDTKLPFGIDDLKLIRFNELPQWYLKNANQDYKQPDVEWPTADEVNPFLQSRDHWPRVQNNAFVDASGRRSFVINPYVREVQEFDLWGNGDASSTPVHDLFDVQAHGWIYNELLTETSLGRLGFNSLSVTMPPKPWVEHLKMNVDDFNESAVNFAQAPPLKDMLRRTRMPLHVDTVCWPWTLGRPAEKNALPEHVITPDPHHWVHYKIIGDGKQLWMDLWRTYAERYAEAGANVLTFELMNEPAYLPETEDHHLEFETWLEERYHTIRNLNRVWGSEVDTWKAAARARKIEGRNLDYDEYIAHRFADLIKDGSEMVQDILPGTLIGLQTMSTYTYRPRNGVWKHLVAPHETVVMSPTDGGSWTKGSGRSEWSPILETPIAEAPFEGDLISALAGDGMVIDNERYMGGQGREDTFNTLWKNVFSGVDGFSIFSWNKRGWSWKDGRDKVETLGDRFPFTALNPTARRTESLRGIYDFSTSILPIADDILPKPWGPDARIAYVFSWDDARRREIDQSHGDKRDAYYAAMKYAHWSFEMLPSDRVIQGALQRGFDVAVLPHTVFAESQLPPALLNFVRQGGALIVGEAVLGSDRYGHPLDNSELLGLTLSGRTDHAADTIQVPDALSAPSLPGVIRSRLPALDLKLSEDVEVVLRDNHGNPVLTRHAIGNGHVYFQAADLVGYQLAKIMEAALRDRAKQKGVSPEDKNFRLADIRDHKGQLAGNVLLSRRSYPERGIHAFLLMNFDRYPKTIRFGADLEPGDWSVDLPVGDDTGVERATISSTELQRTGLSLNLAPGAPNVLILREKDGSKLSTSASFRQMPHLPQDYSGSKTHEVVPAK
ncbi:MAG: hypothetical protein GVY36_18660 [Verrucomicrobia bacterium]|jgi:hypothetical protein|nr:hypothetical protein [Verrucomicrobiota bacterium]